jgi:hypothetical protein
MRVKSPYIFISHSSKNNDFTKKLAKDFKAAGFNTWVDLETLQDGERWVAEIQAAVEKCQVIVVVMSRAARESEWVERETLLALALNKPLLIARIEDIPLPLQLITRQFTDFTGDYSPALARLSRSMKTALENPADPVSTGVIKGSEDSDPIVHVSADPNENNFFAYLEQMSGGKMMSLIARDLYVWAKKHADDVEFSGRVSPGFYVKVNTRGGKCITAWSLLAFLRNPAVQIPFDYLSKYPPYTDLQQRLETLEALNNLLPGDERLDEERASRRPTLNLLSALDTAEELENFKDIMQQMMTRLKNGA